MSTAMAWMIVNQETNWSRPRSRYSFNAQTSPEPQQRPRDFVDYCVSLGRAEEVPAPGKQDAPEGSGVVKRARKSRNRA